MGILKNLAASATLVLAMGGGAFAADLGAMPEVPTIDNGAIEPQLGTNWYLRGDIGWAASHVSTNASFDTGGSLDDDGSTWTVGGGIGYDFGWFRTDVTVDYQLERDVDVTSAGRNCAVGGVGTASCTDNRTSSVNTVPILVNGYFDLGTWNGFTPYVGAGAGAALVGWNDWDTTTVDCTAGTGACPAGPPFPSVARNEGADDWQFAWALMAGFSYNLNQNLALDVGYRFLDIENGKASTNYIVTTNGPSIGSIDFSDLYSHEVRVGFRYTID